MRVFSLFCQAFDCSGHLRRAIGRRRVSARKGQDSVIIENVRAVQMHDPADFRMVLVENAVREGFRRRLDLPCGLQLVFRRTALQDGGVIVRL